MATDTPIACSLSADDLLDRREQIRRIGRDGLITVDDRAGGVRVVFADDPGIRARLEGIVAAEAACCPFLDLELDRDPAGITLTIAAPAEAAPVVEDLIAGFTGART